MDKPPRRALDGADEVSDAGFLASTSVQILPAENGATLRTHHMSELVPSRVGYGFSLLLAFELSDRKSVMLPSFTLA